MAFVKIAGRKKMANFDSGVKGYIKGYAVVEVHFPVDWKDKSDISCFQCKFYSRNNGVCQLTKEVSEYPQNFVGSNCPLEIQEQ